MSGDVSAQMQESPEHFLLRSFRLLDAGEFIGWLALCATDMSYIVTTPSNLEKHLPVAIIQDNFARLEGRVQSIVKFWHAELPRTRTVHMVTNIEVEAGPGDAVLAHSCFQVFATRRDKQISLVGRYRDTLRRSAGAWQLTTRLAVLSNDVLHDGNITFIV
jgi:3-phenylpropionate/cinnamic acid dioxygenase small subunit